MTNLNIVFLSSSDFTIPILESLLNEQKQTFAEILSTQIKYLEGLEKPNLESAFENPEKQGVADPQKSNKNSSLALKIKPDIKKIQEAIAILNTEILNSIPKVSLIISQPDKQNRKKIVQNPVSIFAEKKNTDLFKPHKINQEWEQKADILENAEIAITASFGQIISSKVLNLPKHGFINWHPSLLPLYRGATPMQESLKNGDTQTGLSWIEMTAGMDAGNILLQTPKKIEKNQGFNELAAEMGGVGKNTWAIAVLGQILKKNYSTKRFDSPQDEKKATFTKLLSKEDALVDTKTQTAVEIFNQFRAYKAFPKIFFIDNSYFKQKIKLQNLEILDSNPEFDSMESEIKFQNEDYLQLKIGKKTQTFLICKDKTYLLLSEITLENGKNINLKGYNFSAL